MNTQTDNPPIPAWADFSSESHNKTPQSYDTVKLNPDGSVTTYRQRSKSYRPTLKEVDRLVHAQQDGIESAILEQLLEGYNPDGGLGLLDAANYHRPKAPSSRRGLKGIQSAARSAVRNSVAVLSDSVDVRTLGFITFTLPGVQHGLSADEVKTINENWSEVTRQLHQQIRRYQRSNGIPDLYVSVTEVQPKRYKEKGQVALHLHILTPIRAHYWSKWAHVTHALRRIWGQVLEARVGHPVNASAAVDIREVKSADAVAGYIGKYMTKGGDLLNDIIAKGLESQLPTAWYSRSQDLVAMVREATVYLKGQAARDFVGDMERMEADGVITLHPVEISITDRKTGELSNLVIAYSGWFADRATMRAYKRWHGIKTKEQQPVCKLNPVPFSTA